MSPLASRNRVTKKSRARTSHVENTSEGEGFASSLHSAVLPSACPCQTT